MKRVAGEVSVVRMMKDLRRDEVTTRLLVIGPARVFAGLQAYAIGKGWKPGWAAFAFKEIFGAWPRRQDRVEPAILDGYVVEEWVAGRKKRARIKAAKPVPLLDRAREPPKLNADGFVSGTLMTPEDFEAGL